ncbi:serine hydrolase [Vibrio chagasii]|nr:serine hydrolase [Vibrio chagasii]
MNHARPGDARDTTTPDSIVMTLNELMYGDTLSQASKATLKGWMMDNKVSDGMFRSILPSGWNIADESGAGAYGSRAITAIVWSEHRAPLIISVSLTETEFTLQQRDKVINEVGPTYL